MKKWTSKARLFERDYVFIPIHENFHWYLALICNPRKCLLDEESDESSDGKGGGDSCHEEGRSDVAGDEGMEGRNSVDRVKPTREDIVMVEGERGARKEDQPLAVEHGGKVMTWKREVSDPYSLSPRTRTRSGRDQGRVDDKGWRSANERYPMRSRSISPEE